MLVVRAAPCGPNGPFIMGLRPIIWAHRALFRAAPCGPNGPFIMGLRPIILDLRASLPWGQRPFSCLNPKHIDFYFKGFAHGATAPFNLLRKCACENDAERKTLSLRLAGNLI